jgi:integrase/recombinase XerC
MVYWKGQFEVGQNEFLTYLDIARQLSKHTLRAYRVDLDNFTQWLDNQPDDPIPNKQLPSLYLADLARQGVARATIARRASCLKTFFKFLLKEEVFEVSDFNLRYHRPKLEQTLPDFLTPPEVEQLERYLQSWPADAWRERALSIVYTLFTSGIRVSELVGLNVGSVDWDSGDIRVQGKGGRERVAFVSARALTQLQRWKTYLHEMLGEPRQPLHEETPLFINQRGDRLTDRSVHRYLVQWGKAAGLLRPLHPHLFRHSFATHLLNSGVELRLVQELLGHVSIRSTQIYTHVSTERLKEAFLAAHPRAAL